MLSSVKEREVQLDRVTPPQLDPRARPKLMLCTPPLLPQICARNWKYGYCKSVVLLNSDAQIQYVRFLEDFVAFGTNQGDCYVVEMGSGDVVAALEGHDAEVTALAFDAEYLISGGADNLVLLNRISLWASPVQPLDDGDTAVGGLETQAKGEGQVTLGAALHCCTGHTDRVTGVERLSKQEAVSCSVDGKVMKWDLNSGECLATWDMGSPVLALGTADGFVAVGLFSGKVVFLDGSSGKAVMEFDAHGSDPVRCLDFPSKDVLVTGGQDGLVKYWDLIEGGEPQGEGSGSYWVDGRNVTHRFSGHTAPVVAVASDECKIVSACLNGDIRVWDLKLGLELYRIEGHQNIKSVNFDRTRMITDGTLGSIVIRDFSEEGGGDDEDVIIDERE
ncbi:unnamed protein product [Chrysoparadoxa australica]